MQNLRFLINVGRIDTYYVINVSQKCVQLCILIFFNYDVYLSRKLGRSSLSECNI